MKEIFYLYQQSHHDDDDYTYQRPISNNEYYDPQSFTQTFQNLSIGIKSNKTKQLAITKTPRTIPSLILVLLVCCVQNMYYPVCIVSAAFLSKSTIIIKPPWHPSSGNSHSLPKQRHQYKRFTIPAKVPIAVLMKNQNFNTIFENNDDKRNNVPVEIASEKNQIPSIRRKQQQTRKMPPPALEFESEMHDEYMQLDMEDFLKSENYSINHHNNNIHKEKKKNDISTIFNDDNDGYPSLDEYIYTSNKNMINDDKNSLKSQSKPKRNLPSSDKFLPSSSQLSNQKKIQKQSANEYYETSKGNSDIHDNNNLYPTSSDFYSRKPMIGMNGDEIKFEGKHHNKYGEMRQNNNNDDLGDLDYDIDQYVNHGNIETNDDAYLSSDSIHDNENNNKNNKYSHQMDIQNQRQMQLFMPSVILEKLNPSQYEAVTTPLHSITRVIAGPGAGKTRVLTSRIAYLLYKNSNYEYNDDAMYGIDSSRKNRILAVTFTKKAAGEMKERLQKLCMEADNEICKHFYHPDNINKNESRGPNNDVGHLNEIRQEEENDEEENTKTPSILDKVTVGTFHSICARILRYNGDYLSTLLPSTVSNLSGNFDIIDQSEQIRLIKKCLTEKGYDLKDLSVKGTSIKPIQIVNMISKLKEEDYDVLMTDGKESVSVNHQISNNKMKNSLATIVEEIYPLYTNKLYSSNRVDFNDLILLTRLLLMKYPEVQQKSHQYWTHILVDEFQDTSKAQLDLVNLWTTNSLMVVGDSDQSIYSWRGANGVESMRDVVKRYGESNGKYAENVDEESMGLKPTKEGVITVHLMENYRSTTNIIKAAQRIINAGSKVSRSTGTSPDGGADVRQNMKPMRETGPAPRILACSDAKAEASWVVKHIQSMSGSTLNLLGPTSSVAIIYRSNAQSRVIEEACVANNLRYAVRGASGAFYSRAEIKDCLCFLKWLNNGNDETSMMRCFKTPSRGIGAVAINEFVSYCDEVNHYIQREGSSTVKSFSLLDILTSLSESSESSNRPPLPPESIISKRALNRILSFSEDMKRIREKTKILSVSELLSEIIATLNLKAHFDSISKSKDEFTDRLNNVMELCKAAERFSEDGPSIPPPADEKVTIENSMDDDSTFRYPLEGFLDDVALLSGNEDDSNSDEGKGGVLANLMTIHTSKGMEFDAVFLIGNEEGTFPTQRAIAEGDGSIALEEERRLCYVAMTRAKTHLFLTWRREVMIFTTNGVKIMEPNRSRFLDELIVPIKKKKKSKQRKKDAVSRNHGSRNNPIRRVSSSQRVEMKKKLDRKENTTYNNGNDKRGEKVIPCQTFTEREQLPQLPSSPQGKSWEDWDPSSTY